MENNLTTSKHRQGTVPELLAKTMTQSELLSHASKVELRLEVVSRKFDRFGWDQISKEVRTILKADWTAALLNYSEAEIDEAIRGYVDDVKNRKAPHEGQIKAIIIANRQHILGSQPKPPDTYIPVDNPITPEAHAALMKEYGFDGKVNPRKFTETP